MNKRGSVTILVAATVPFALVLGIFALDAGRVWLAKARLQAALDAAALSAARDIGDTKNRAANAAALAAANNWGGGAPPLPGQSSTGWKGSIQVTESSPNQIQVTGSVEVSPLLGRLSIPGWQVPGTTAKVITRTAVANRANTGIELALVMDTTLSMALWDSASGTDTDGKKPARVELARRAARSLTSILYGSQTEYQPNLYISVVPFNVAINIGNGTTQQGWIAGSVPSYASVVQTFTWSGCVEARLNGYDRTDDAPSTAKFQRYYWPNTYVVTETSANSAYCTSYQDYKTTGGGTGPCMGDNDWTAPGTDQDKNYLITSGETLLGYFGNYVVRPSNLRFSPNFMCPSVSILPLTMDRATVEKKIDELVGTSANPYPFGYGTVIASGLQGAWYTLSDKWQNVWDNPNPVRSDGTRLTPPSALPLAYNTPKMNKVVLLLSDGDNNWFNARDVQGLQAISGTGSGNTLVRTASRTTELFYTAYGRLNNSNNRLNITIPTGATPNSSQLATDYATLRTRADAALDTVMQDLCTKMKAKGIIIYAVGVGVPDSDKNAHTQLQSCVSPSTADSPGNKYIRTANASELTAAFTQVANELANLRLSQ